jgi:hypothetical protein
MAVLALAPALPATALVIAAAAAGFTAGRCGPSGQVPPAATAWPPGADRDDVAAGALRHTAPAIGFGASAASPSSGEDEAPASGGPDDAAAALGILGPDQVRSVGPLPPKSSCAQRRAFCATQPGCHGLQVWAAAWRSLDAPEQPAARPAAGRAARQPSADPRPGLKLVFGRARRARGASPDAGRAPVAGAGAARGGAGRPRLALQGVAPGPRAQLLALALAALEQGVAALPAETLRWA